MAFLSRFKQWLSDDLKVDYETIAADVRGLAEHVEDEFHDMSRAISEDYKALAARIGKIEALKEIGMHPDSIDCNIVDEKNGPTGA